MKFHRAVLTDTRFENADLRSAEGLLLDSTFIRNARFSSHSKDRWSILRRNYTGPKLLFNLLLLVVFVIPYAARTMMWVGINRSQAALQTTTNRLEEAANDLRREGHPTSALLDNIVNEISKLQPCLRQDCKQSSVWKELLSVNNGASYWLLAVALLVFNLCRAFLTWVVGPLRDEEERSGYSPPLGYKANWLNEKKKLGNFFKAVRPRRDGYGWLIGLHWVVSVLFFISIASFIWHGYNWLKAPVFLPT